MFSSPRHRSSTLKPIKPPPARLNIVPPPSPQSPQFVTPRPTSPASAQFTPVSASPALRPTSPAPTHDHPHSIAPTQHTGGIRAHLAHLLPRHAAFTVTVTLHQLHNVPLVHGEFGLKWNIKGVTSHSGNGILDKVKARKAKGKLYDQTRSGTSTADPTPSLAEGSDTDNASLFDAASASDAHSIANSSSTHSPSNDYAHSTGGSAHGHTTRTQPVQIPAVVISANHASPPQVARSVSGTSSIASVGSASSMSSNGRRVHNPPCYLSAGWSRQGPARDTETLFSLPNGNTTHHPQAQTKLHYSPAKGITPFVKLKEHSVVWEKTLKLVVQMSVSRDNDGLGNCLAKFVVMQVALLSFLSLERADQPVHVACGPWRPRCTPQPTSRSRPPQPRTIRRCWRHHKTLSSTPKQDQRDAQGLLPFALSRSCHSHVVTQLTIHLEHTAGELAYVAPPLPKGEILSGVASFLESSDIYRTRPRASDLYTHVSSGSSSDNVGTASGSDTSSIVSGSGASYGAPNQSHRHGIHGTVRKQRRPFEVSKLPMINDPKGTEKLIEALFNPVPVTQLGKVTPFTYLVEADGEGDRDGDGDEHGDGERGSYGANPAATVHEGQGTRRGTVDGEADEDGSLYTDSPDESADEANGMGSDYHSLRSHPSLQGSLRSKRSTRSLGSKVGSKHDVGGEETVVSTGVRLLGGVAERRTWWQKVLSPPAVG